MFRFNPLSRIHYSSRSPSSIITRNFTRNSIFKRFQNTTTTPPKKEKGIKALVKEYGYSALGVYLGLSAIDLPICYMLVHSLGQDEIEYYENKVKQQFGYGVSDDELKKGQEINKIHKDMDSTNKDQDSVSNSSVLHRILSQFSWTEFAIAYSIHKSLIFIRVPITAAITPGIVKLLRRWGFKIGTDKLSTTATIAKDAIKDITASNPKFGTRPTSKKKWFNFFF